MAMFIDTLTRAQEYFPKLKIKYKNESLFMRLLSIVLFFNKDFMNYTTTIGTTIYFSSQDKVKRSPIGSTIILLHELTHIWSESKNTILYKILYLFPQILSLLSIPILILFGWKLAILFLIFLLPIPAYWRAKEELRAYTISLYVMNKINNIENSNINLDNNKQYFTKQFYNPAYYFMYPFNSINKTFDSSLEEIKMGKKPIYDAELYSIIDKVFGA